MTTPLKIACQPVSTGQPERPLVAHVTITTSVPMEEGEMEFPVFFHADATELREMAAAMTAWAADLEAIPAT